MTGGVAALAGIAGWRSLQGADPDFRIPGPLRAVHETNEAIWSTLMRDDHLATEYPISEASVLRVNGLHGIRDDIDLDTWEITVLGPDGEQLGTHALDDIKALPWHEMTIEHKCIEGWSQVTNWQGARFSDFFALYQDRLPDDITHVFLQTPDGEYYVSVDMATMQHPQTLLAYDNFGEAISDRHLRLAGNGDQADQAHRIDPVPARSGRRLLGRTGLRLVRRPVTLAGTKVPMWSTVVRAHSVHDIGG